MSLTLDWIKFKNENEREINQKQDSKKERQKN